MWSSKFLNEGTVCMFKKSKVWFVLLVLPLVLAACGSDGNDPAPGSSNGSSGEAASPSGEITVWAHPYVSEEKAGEMKAFWDSVIQAYNAKFPDVKVKFEEIPWKDREQKILTALSSGTGPDVFYQIPDQVPQFANQGVLAPLDDYLTDDDLADFNEGALKAGNVDGKQYALPILQETQTLIYNADIVKDIGEDPANLPTTWDEFNAWAEKAAAKGYYARDFAGAEACCNATLYPLLWQKGGDVLAEDGSVILDNEAGVATFQYIKDMYDKKWIPADSVSNKDQFPEFLSGKMMAIWGSGYTLTVLNEEKINYVIGEPLTDRTKATFGTVGMFVVSDKSKNKEAAAEFVKLLTDTENQKTFNKLTNYIPTRKSAASIHDGDEAMKKMTAIASVSRAGIVSPVARTIMPKIQAEIAAMLEGGKTPQEAASAAAAAVRDELAKVK
ncbi:hypothetical protein PACILC2_55120 [Paenibacillus cisolokensis]|uniref:ABC transporter substrate-binding protein n=1 Tax=Paenibacillus cisolokensis TaxID=1658519 RepID=A0ABQ4NFC4_9BACL|nr:sugar ABC transporter substrate-binding protein [Paenibacillus cisolokensis]GIQ66944.1 hypothetical protein PACILC2_55120 [Paenibacillus cisolokensis]